MAKRYSDEIKEQARLAYMSGEPVAHIAARLGVNSRRIIYNWRDKYEWEKLRKPASAIEATSRRYEALIDKDKKNQADWEEIDKLAELLVRFERIELQKAGCQGTGRPNGSKNNKNKAKKRKKNDVSHLTAEDFEKVEASGHFYQHQKIWLDAGENELTRRIRFILKSRQIGATYTFAYQAFKWAVLKKHNQIFISSTKAQAKVFRSYMSIIARDLFDVELSGDPCTLSNLVELHYLSPAGYTDSRSGDVWFDEVFKTRKFTEMENVAAPMATLSQFSKTYFSSPTAVSHDAYEKWSGEHYTKFHKHIRINVDVPKKGDCELTKGRLDEDGIWRNAITIHDAIRMGWDKVSLKQLKREMPDPVLFAVTFEGQFIDDKDSVFNLQKLLNCGVDIEESWRDFNPKADRPIGNLPCTAGYDPAGVGDNASFCTLTFPTNNEEKFRLLQKDVWHNMSAPAQCLRIEERTKQYRYDYAEVDATGPGLYIPDFIRPFIPNVRSIQYNTVYKTIMVQKALSVIDANRFEYDENDDNLPLAFMTIYQKATSDGRITYSSRRAKDVGHGDEAWACMHAMMCEPLNPDSMGAMRVSIYN